MDFLDPKKKKAHRIKLLVGYGLIAIALGFATTILFYQYYYGFRLDPKTGQIVQNGLVFIDAQPTANVTLNGENKGQTDMRLDIPAGNYELDLSQTGYRNWKRSFTLEGGYVERFVYPFLFPEKLVTADAQLYAAAPTLATASPDRHWLVVAQPGSLTAYDVIDLSSEVAASRVITLPASLLETKGKTHNLELVEWSTNNRHLLIKHTFEGGQEFFVLDIESPGSSVNLNRTFKIPFTNVTLRDKKFDLYYLHNVADQTLYTATLSSGQATPYLSDVLTYRPHGSDVVVYVTDAGAPDGKVLMRVREGVESFDLREFAANNSYVVDVARFDNAWYFGGGAAAEQKVYVYKNPVAAAKRRPTVRPVPVGVLRLDKAPEAISFSTNARFLIVQGGSQFSAYDAETDRQYRFETGLTLAPGQKATWMDGHRLVVTTDNKTIVFDYDGTNKQVLSPAVNGSLPLFDRDYTALFNVAPAVSVPSRYAITRTELRVTPN